MPLKEARRVDASEIARLQLHLLADPGEGLLWCLCERATVNEEIVRHLFERVLILAPGGVDELDKAVLVELRAMREHVVRKRYPDRPSGIACCRYGLSHVAPAGLSLDNTKAIPSAFARVIGLRAAA